MSPLDIVLILLALAFLSTTAVLWLAKTKLAQSLNDQRRKTLEAESARDLAQARIGDLENQEIHMREMFGSLAADALKSNATEFLKLATQTFNTEQEKAKGELELRKQAVEGLVKPMREQLDKTGETLERIEKKRIEDHGVLKQQTEEMAKTNSALRTETSKLVSALRKPQVRGRYGEIQLERVVELAGMRDYCDFTTQANIISSTGEHLRPDLVVRLPNDRLIAIDAKTNIDAYLDAIEANTPDEAERHLERFAKHVLDQAKALAKKEYSQALEHSPEFVVMFIPGDQFIDAALQRQPNLLDFAADAGVILASPSTLIGLLRAVHVGWREKQLTDNAQELFKLGKELHERAVGALEHAAKVGEAIDTAKKRFNNFVGSVDSRLMPTLRKFEEHGASSDNKKLTDLTPLEGDTRDIQSLPAVDAPLTPSPPGRGLG